MGATLLIDKRNTRLSLASPNVLQMHYETGRSEKAGLNAVKTVVILGDVDLSAGVLRALSESQTEVVLLSGRGKKSPIYLLPMYSGGMALRLAQYGAFQNDAKRLAIAKAFVSAKVIGQYRLLAAQERYLPLERLLESVSRTTDIASLMGAEGASTARYFHIWRELITPPWQFTTRQRQPPGDPINALLSLSYAMATTKVIHLLASRGLESNLGFLHGPQRNRPSLALDLLEPLRPVIDNWVRELLCEQCALLPSHFSHSKQEGTRLNQEGRQIYFGIWANSVDNWLRNSMRQSLALLLKNIRHEIDHSVVRYREDGESLE